MIVQNAYMGPVVEYSIQTEAGLLFTREPAYTGLFHENQEVFVHIRPEEIIIIPDKYH